MGSEPIGSGRRQSDRQSTGDQSHVEDAGPLQYGFSYALVTTPQNGMTNGVLILCIILDRERIGSGRRQSDFQSTGEQSHIDDTGPPVYGFNYALVLTLRNGITDGVLIL
jgi:hypothetical protein